MKDFFIKIKNDKLNGYPLKLASYHHCHALADQLLPRAALGSHWYNKGICDQTRDELIGYSHIDIRVYLVLVRRVPLPEVVSIVVTNHLHQLQISQYPH